MKSLIFFISLISPLILYSAPKMNWCWFATDANFGSSYKLVRTAAPEGMESPDYSILVVYSWKFEPSCDDVSNTNARAEMEKWSSKLNAALRGSQVGFSIATIVEPDRIQEYFYVSDLNAFRTLSLVAGEVMVDTPVSYEFSRDLDWNVWQELREERLQPIQLVRNEEEE